MSTLIKILISLAIYYNFTEFKSEYQSFTQEKTLEQSIKDGQWVYEDFCMRCHLPTGKGVSGVYPPLAQSDWLVDKVDKSIASLKYGLKGEIKVNGETYNNVMPAQGLSDEEIADVMNYIMNSWDNTQEDMITPKQVKAIEQK
ncbi:c-type cytochrome [Mesohalobacter halotolerans]|uniref:Cytochrome c n=1 Tax=Mesohalobacter halotolerans TaxID=1883405 RepID=A0A4U5TNW8_9FLAO|nr:cytochrome c [Mesohalobacter halotolerans]MBS3738424.1 cytochrome c [Psychroflexus sp.]TKS55583.1 cytochrome c [Mesohalobacter halotolerans]